MSSENQLFSQKLELYKKYLPTEIISPEIFEYTFQNMKIVYADRAIALFVDPLDHEYNNHKMLIDYFPVFENQIELFEASSFFTLFMALEGSTDHLPITINRNHNIFIFAKFAHGFEYFYVGMLDKISVSFRKSSTKAILSLHQKFPDHILMSVIGFKLLIYDPTDFLMPNSPILQSYRHEDAELFTNMLLKRHGGYGYANVIKFNRKKIAIHSVDERAFLDYSEGSIRVSAYDPMKKDSTEEINDPNGDTWDTVRVKETIPREDAIKALNEFIDTGQRPTCVKWRE